MSDWKWIPTGMLVGALAAMLPVASSAVTLSEVVDSALATHPELLERVHERRIRDEYIEEARSGKRPDINLMGGYGHEHSSNVATGGEWVGLTRKELAIDLRLPLYDGGETQTNLARLEAGADAGAYQLRAEAERVALSVTEAYLDVLRDRQLLDLALVNLSDHERIYDQIHQRAQSGVGRRSEVSQVDARRALAESNMIASEASLQDSRANYARAVGAWPAEAMQAPGTERDDLPSTLENALAQARDTHPAVIAAEAEIEAAKMQAENARSLRRPRIELQASAKYGEDLDGTVGREKEMLLMLNLNYNLYSGGAHESRIRRSIHLVDLARDIRNGSVREVYEAVRVAWNAMTSMDRRIDALGRHVGSSELAREAYSQQFNIGERSLLDLLDAENELFEARRNLVGAQRDQTMALFRVRAGMGNLVYYLNVGLPEEGIPQYKRVRTP